MLSVDGDFDLVVLNKHEHLEAASLVERKVWHSSVLVTPGAVSAINADYGVSTMWIVEAHVKAHAQVVGLHARTVLQVDFESF